MDLSTNQDKKTRTGGRIIATAEYWRLPQPRLIPSWRSRMIPKQCSVILHSRSHLPLPKFNRTTPQLHQPPQRIPLSKEYSLLQVLGCKCWRPQPQETHAVLLLRYSSPKWPCWPKMRLGLFQLQMRISFPFLLTKNIHGYLLLVRARSSLYRE